LSHLICFCADMTSWSPWTEKNRLSLSMTCPSQKTQRIQGYTYTKPVIVWGSWFLTAHTPTGCSDKILLWCRWQRYYPEW
jgi:hypothetical protein